MFLYGIYLSQPTTSDRIVETFCCPPTDQESGWKSAREVDISLLALGELSAIWPPCPYYFSLYEKSCVLFSSTCFGILPEPQDKSYMTSLYMPLIQGGCFIASKHLEGADRIFFLYTPILILFIHS